jgi:hypothetical protein
LKLLKIRYFRIITPLRALCPIVASYALEAYKVCIESVVVEISKGLIQLEIERASAFFNS